MKNTLILLLALIVASCAQDQNKDNKVKSNGTTTPNSATTLDPNNINPVQPATNSGHVNVAADENGVVFHYVCSDLCEGGSANDAGPCPVCGKELSHNQAFHAQDQSATPQLNQGDLPPGLQDLTNGNSVSPMVTTPPPTQEPAQNAQGVWHYTCASGCAGGAGAAIACSTCGATLAHNAGYH